MTAARDWEWALIPNRGYVVPCWRCGLVDLQGFYAVRWRGGQEWCWPCAFAVAADTPLTPQQPSAIWVPSWQIPKRPPVPYRRPL